MSLIPAALAAGLALGIAACGGDPPATGPIRLVDDPGIAREGAFLAWGTTAAVGGDTRPVLSTVKPLEPPFEVVAGATPASSHLRVVLPEPLKAVPWLVLETVVTRDGVTTMMRSWPITASLAGTRYDVAVLTERVGDGRAGLRLWPCPDLVARDVETGPVAVPRDAVLSVAVGVERVTLETLVAPLAMTVAAAVDGVETVLGTVTIDRVAARRGWTELAAPLDAFAGRNVRLRFRARPTIGPTAVPVLPLWGDPTIASRPGPASP